jgi:hypothetical protein
MRALAALQTNDDGKGEERQRFPQSPARAAAGAEGNQDGAPGMHRKRSVVCLRKVTGTHVPICIKYQRSPKPNGPRLWPLPAPPVAPASSAAQLG